MKTNIMKAKIRINEIGYSIIEKTMEPLENLLMKMEKRKISKYHDMSELEKERYYNRASTKILKRVFSSLYEQRKNPESAESFELIVGVTEYNRDVILKSKSSKKLVDFLSHKECSAFNFVYNEDYAVEFSYALAKSFEESPYFKTNKLEISNSVYILQIKLNQY